MPTINLLYQRQYKINDSIEIVIPTVGEILDNEDSYYNMVSLLTAMPIDLQVQLDDIDIDYTTINDWDLFRLIFDGLKSQDTSLIFGDLDLSSFELMVDNRNGKMVLVSEEEGAVIDRAVHGQIVATLRKIHHLKKNYRKPGNDEAKRYMLERARAKMKRNKNRSSESYLESLIIALVNTEQFKYDYEGTRNLSIYQFNESVRQITKKINYDNVMYGLYSGTVSSKDINLNDVNWLSK